MLAGSWAAGTTAWGVYGLLRVGGKSIQLFGMLDALVPRNSIWQLCRHVYPGAQT